MSGEFAWKKGSVSWGASGRGPYSRATDPATQNAAPWFTAPVRDPAICLRRQRVDADPRAKARRRPHSQAGIGLAATPETNVGASCQ
jgi:hypothetical protein